MAKRIDEIERVKQVKVTLDDVRAIVDAMRHLPPERRCIEASIGQLVKLFPGDENITKRMAISFRMTAFSLLIEDADKFGISFIKRPDGSVSVNDAVLSAVAKTPLVERDEQLVFDPAELFRRAKEYEARETLR